MSVIIFFLRLFSDCYVIFTYINTFICEIIASKEIVFTAVGNVTNSCDVHAVEDVSFVAGSNVTNGGKVTATENVSFTAQEGYIINKGGVSGEEVAFTAASNIVNEAGITAGKVVNFVAGNSLTNGGSITAKTGNIPERDMFNTFNMGVGMSIVVAPEDVDKFMAEAKKEIELLSGEYSLVTAYLNDTEEDCRQLGAMDEETGFANLYMGILVRKAELVESIVDGLQESDQVPNDVKAQVKANEKAFRESAFKVFDAKPE